MIIHLMIFRLSLADATSAIAFATKIIFILSLFSAAKRFIFAVFFVCKFFTRTRFYIKTIFMEGMRVSEWERVLLKVQWNFSGYQMYMLSVKFTLAVLSKVPMLQHYGNKQSNHRLIENAQFYGYCLYVYMYILLFYESFWCFFYIFYLSKFICIFGEI